ncbi:MAG TPA: efflux transporter outer membrane subunit [Vicinamibacterales bacterium]|nr:efflux transporter outer membrane subunit [Vicinamibacterales bacterium]
MTPQWRAICAAATALSCGACAVGPTYHVPSTEIPAAFKESAPASPAAANFLPAQPGDDTIRALWWEVFDDAQLNDLETRATAANQNVAQAEAAFRAARAAVRGARAGLFPTLTGGATATRSRPSSNRVTGFAPGASNDYQLTLDFSYEADVWGRVRRNVEANVATAQASAADVQTALLIVTSELAVDYFQLRGIDAQFDLLERTIASYERALMLTTARFNQGVASGIDVAQAQTQLESARVQATDLGTTRAQLEHAIATLTGAPPANVTIAPAVIATNPPSIPAMVPSRLLERRPDVAAAERRVASANAMIGVAKAAYFPSISLSGSGGVESSVLGDLLTLPSRIWSIGPALAATIFDGGLRHALTDQAVAGHDEAVATYRQNVLTALQDVEDNLAALRILAQEAQQAEDLVAAAQRSLVLANAQYTAGVASYLQVISAQTAALTAEATLVDIRARRMTASVLLVKALGGGWSSADLPQPNDLRRSS